jgi:DNA-binding MarR family transcriptional regulator
MAQNRRLPASAEVLTGELDEVLAFMRMLWAVDHGLQSISKRMAASIGVTGPQRLVVRIVGQHPGIPAGELASVLHMHPSTLTGVLKRLQSRGMIKRRIDPADRRRALFELTEKGRVIDRTRSGTVEAAVRRTLQHLAPARVAAAREVLSVLAERLDDEG